MKTYFILLLLFLCSYSFGQDTSLVYMAKQKEVLTDCQNLFKLSTISSAKKAAMLKKLATYTAIDTLNYYINPLYSGTRKDGSILYPFNSISKAPIMEGRTYLIEGIDTINGLIIDKSYVSIEGGKLVSKGEINLTSKGIRFGNVTIEGFNKTNGLHITGDSCVICNCRLSNFVFPICIENVVKSYVWYNYFDTYLYAVKANNVRNIELVENKPAVRIIKYSNVSKIIQYTDNSIMVFEHE